MMNLFDVVPEGLFHLLTGSNRKIYAEALLLLYEHSQRERFGIRYEVMRDLLQELLETQQETGMVISADEDELGWSWKRGSAYVRGCLQSSGQCIAATAGTGEVD